MFFHKREFWTDNEIWNVPSKLTSLLGLQEQFFFSITSRLFSQRILNFFQDIIIRTSCWHSTPPLTSPPPPPPWSRGSAQTPTTPWSTFTRVEQRTLTVKLIISGSVTSIIISYFLMHLPAKKIQKSHASCLQSFYKLFYLELREIVWLLFDNYLKSCSISELCSRRGVKCCCQLI